MPQTEFDYFLTPDGEEHNLHDFAARVVMSRDGYGMPPIEWHTSRGPFQHGETALDYRLRPRMLQLILHWRAWSREELWSKRDDLLDIIRPNRSDDASPARLRKILPNGDIRDIYVQIQSGPSFGPERPTRWEEWSFEQAVRFVAHDPLWFDPEQQIYTGGSGNLVYLGNWQDWPIIEYTGSMVDPTITNVTLGETISMVYSIVAGRVVTIDLAPGVKTVIDDLGNNLIEYVSGDLTTWRLEGDPLAPNGVNQILFNTVASYPGSGMRILYYNRWIGI